MLSEFKEALLLRRSVRSRRSLGQVPEFLRVLYRQELKLLTGKLVEVQSSRSRRLTLRRDLGVRGDDRVFRLGFLALSILKIIIIIMF